MIRTRLYPLVILALTASTAWAGPDWEEGAMGTGDAGSLPADAQVPRGQPPLTPLQKINGQIGTKALAGDDGQDMFLIYIDDPLDFSATANAPVALTFIDAQLWLFNAAGFGILANDGAGSSAGFGNMATDSSGAGVTAPGAYLLAISPFNSDPIDSAGMAIFDQGTAPEVSGPDGPGGGNPIAGWSSSAATGSYTIELTGAAYVPCHADVNSDGNVDVDDLVAVIIAWGSTNPDADIDNSGTVDVDDLIEVIIHWNTCNPA